jgi:Methane oxygenase PmoA
MRFFITVIAMSLAGAVQAGGFDVEEKPGSITIKHGKVHVTTFHFGKDVAKPYLWPLTTPKDVGVTRDWPMKKGTAGETTDHVHQKSAWFCHGDVIPEGIELKTKSSDKRVQGVDFWSEAAGHGTIVCTRAGKVIRLGDSLLLDFEHEWKSPDGVVILKDTRSVAITALKHGYLFVFDIDLISSQCPITFGDTKEGAFGVRVPDSVVTLKSDGGVVTSSDGTTAGPNKKGTLPMWGQQADWHDYSSKTAGLAIFDHPKNANRANWHTRDYGLMAANPFGRKESGFPAQKDKTDLVKLKKDEYLNLKYALYVHDGDATTAEVGETYKNYSAGK